MEEFNQEKQGRIYIYIYICIVTLLLTFSASFLYAAPDDASQRTVVNGACNQAEKGCISGTLNDEVYPDSPMGSSPTYDRWRCDGRNGGSNSGLCVTYKKLNRGKGILKYQFDDFNVIYAEKFNARPVEGTNHSAAWIRNLVSNPDEMIYVTYGVINLTRDSHTFVQSHAGGTEDRTYLATPSWLIKEYIKVKGSKGSRSFLSSGASYSRNGTGSLREIELNYWTVSKLLEGNLTSVFIKDKNDASTIDGIVHKRNYGMNGNGGIDGNQFLFFESRSDEVRPDSPHRNFYEMSRHDEIKKLTSKDPDSLWVPFMYEMVPETFVKVGEEPMRLYEGSVLGNDDPTEERGEVRLISVRKYE